mmetsp:Transcript_14270/g.35429  ORF Transcript_14270/g.35429 Transcript_14270/m.35429 type:complete len:312 (+) Transcript_14270:3267-4202(+)
MRITLCKIEILLLFLEVFRKATIHHMLPAYQVFSVEAQGFLQKPTMPPADCPQKRVPLLPHEAHLRRQQHQFLCGNCTAPRLPVHLPPNPAEEFAEAALTVRVDRRAEVPRTQPHCEQVNCVEELQHHAERVFHHVLERHYFPHDVALLQEVDQSQITMLMLLLLMQLMLAPRPRRSASARAAPACGGFRPELDEQLASAGIDAPRFGRRVLVVADLLVANAVLIDVRACPHTRQIAGRSERGRRRLPHDVGGTRLQLFCGRRKPSFLRLSEDQDVDTNTGKRNPAALLGVGVVVVLLTYLRPKAIKECRF